MYNEVAAALEMQDYQTAIRLLKPLLKSEPDNPWVQYYAACVHEGRGKKGYALKCYRQLLPQTTHPQLMKQLRQGIARLEALEQKHRAAALERALAAPDGRDNSVLILEPIASELKPQAAQKFAKIFKLDAYTARLQLPSRGWRLYRVGQLGQLRLYSRDLQKASIPHFCASLEAIASVEVYNVNYFQFAQPQVTARCQNQQGQVGAIQFDWSEVSYRVEGRVPWLESVFTWDAKQQFQRKTQTQDYVYLCDLHLPGRKAILRLCDRNYQFQQGISFATEPSLPSRETVSQNWQKLNQFLDGNLLQIPVARDFNLFAETAFGFQEMLGRIPPHFEIKRSEPNLWDAAFQLYSHLVFTNRNFSQR
ncbi:MAG: tetratricopeptide repeat protein [Jaaginema sp. PMC 1079.18]|nr:tetratricopeptide repeat protein [Jaaginema sp. PMC 1080.18]MEC4851099.1 tetratricopeptide repeat protein [Jaaginema sp. PMC 1079.18]MEC4868146.1 tetratricopeptide repeat protein [Jaaginema sp. PMC 1078.18]